MSKIVSLFKNRTKGIIGSVIIAVLVVCGVALSDYLPDIIVTSPNGVWTDTRAYADFPTAITAIGANVRDVYVVRQEDFVTDTIPANVTLHFYAGGCLNNSGQLNVNTKEIDAGDKNIFIGAGDIDFTAGSIVRSTWFSDIVEAFDMVEDDTLTLVIRDDDHIDADCTCGNCVQLRWESPGNILTVDAGFTLDNIKMIEAGEFQLFAGDGDFDFLDGTQLKLDWFIRLRECLAWVENEEVTIIVSGTNIVDFDESPTLNERFDMTTRSGVFSVSAGVTLTFISSEVLQLDLAKLAFTGDGDVRFTNPSRVSPNLFGENTVPGTTDMRGSIYEASQSLTSGGTIVFVDVCAIDTDLDLSAEDEVHYFFYPEAYIDQITGDEIFTIYSLDNISSPKESKTFDGDVVAVAYPGEGTPELWGAKGNETTDDTVFIQSACDIGGTIVFTKTYLTDEFDITVDHTHLTGGGKLTLKTAAGKVCEVRANYVRIDHLWFHGKDTADTDERGVYCDETYHNCDISHCKFDDFTYCISIDTSLTTEAESWKIYDNLFFDVGLASDPAWGYGVLAADVLNFDISDNIGRDINRHFVYLSSGARYCTVNGNNLTNPTVGDGGAAIKLAALDTQDETSYNIVSNNVIYDSYIGISVEGGNAHHNKIISNTITTSFYPIYIEGKANDPNIGTEITNNSMTAAPAEGIALDDVEETIVANNVGNFTGGCDNIRIEDSGAWATSCGWVAMVHNNIFSDAGGGHGIEIELATTDPVLEWDNHFPDSTHETFVISGNITGYLGEKFIEDDLPDGDATPTVHGLRHCRTNNIAPQNVTAFDDGFPGQILTILGDDGAIGNTTFIDGANLSLPGAANITLANDDVLTMYCEDGTAWHCLSYEDNTP